MLYDIQQSDRLRVFEIKGLRIGQVLEECGKWDALKFLSYDR